MIFSVSVAMDGVRNAMYKIYKKNAVNVSGI